MLKSKKVYCVTCPITSKPEKISVTTDTMIDENGPDKKYATGLNCTGLATCQYPNNIRAHECASMKSCIKQATRV